MVQTHSAAAEGVAGARLAVHPLPDLRGVPDRAAGRPAAGVRQVRPRLPYGLLEEGNHEARILGRDVGVGLAKPRKEGYPRMLFLTAAAQGDPAGLMAVRKLCAVPKLPRHRAWAQADGRVDAQLYVVQGLRRPQGPCAVRPARGVTVVKADVTAYSRL